MAKTAFLGLGVMGFHMAGHLAAKGHQVTVWNRTETKSLDWTAQHKGEVAKDPAAAAFGAEYVFLCLGDDPDVRAVFDQLEPSLGAGMIVVDHTTASADLARELDERCRMKGARFLDAPISGGEAGAVNGKLTIMCGGEEKAFNSAEPVMAAYGKNMTLIGESGAGQLAKSVNQICIAGIVQGLSEGLHFAEKAGLDAEKVIAAISGGEAGAVNGKLTIMCGGEEKAFNSAEPVMAAYGKNMTLIGESGAGQLAKSVNQICIAGIVQGLSEGLHFAEKAGLDAEKVIAAISGGAAQSWQMENRWKTMVEGHFEHGFAVDWMRKDLRITLEAARENGASLPLTATVDQYYADVQAMGGQRWDTSSLIARLKRG